MDASHDVTETAATQYSTELLRRDTEEFELPLLLVDLGDLVVRAVSEAAVRRVGIRPSALVGARLVDHVRGEDQAGTVAALQAMSAGAVDFYRSHGAIGPAGGLVTQWVRALEFGHERLALVEAASGRALRRSPLAEHLGGEPAAMAVGTAGSDWLVECLSGDVTELLGTSSDDLVGRLLSGLVAEGDVAGLLYAGRMAQSELSVSFRLRLRSSSGLWRPLRCVLTALAGSADRCFILVDDLGPGSQSGAERAALLEGHLRSIAAEVDPAVSSAAPVPCPDRPTFQE